MVDRPLCSLYEREESKISHFKIKIRPKGIGETADAFLDEKYLEASKKNFQNLLCFPKKCAIIG